MAVFFYSPNLSACKTPSRFARRSSFTRGRNYMIQWSCGRADGQPALDVNKHTVLYSSRPFFTNKYSFNLVCCTPFGCRGYGYTDICNSIPPPSPSTKTKHVEIIQNGIQTESSCPYAQSMKANKRMVNNFHWRT